MVRRPQDTAQVCRSGHLINGFATRALEENRKFCNKCGAPTMTQCEKCQADILGDYFPSPPTIRTRMRVPPDYCHECGNPYPWTQSKLEAAAEMIDLIAEITEEDKQELKDNLPDIARETPKSDVAVKRWQTIAKKVGGDVYGVLLKVGTDVASEYTKKLLTGQP